MPIAGGEKSSTQYQNVSRILTIVSKTPLPKGETQPSHGDASDLLSRLYRKRIQELGFVLAAAARDGNPRMTTIKKFTEDLIHLFGDEFISNVDKAYASGRMRFWIRLSVVDGVCRYAAVAAHRVLRQAGLKEPLSKPVEEGLQMY